jgi:large subunit ribosomal protein L32
LAAVFQAVHNEAISTMANPKRKQSKRRSNNRRAANRFSAPELARDPIDGSAFRPHRVNPNNGMYRGRQVLDVEA